MSMLGMQADELRGYALSVRSVALRTASLCHEARRDLLDGAVRMEKAADAIEALSDKLQGVMGTRYCELFGTPERAADYFTTQCFGSDSSMCYYCPFDDCDGMLRNSGSYPIVYNALLEWLKGDA